MLFAIKLQEETNISKVFKYKLKEYNTIYFTKIATAN